MCSGGWQGWREWWVVWAYAGGCGRWHGRARAVQARLCCRRAWPCWRGQPPAGAAGPGSPPSCLPLLRLLLLRAAGLLRQRLPPAPALQQPRSCRHPAGPGRHGAWRCAAGGGPSARGNRGARDRREQLDVWDAERPICWQLGLASPTAPTCLKILSQWGHCSSCPRLSTTAGPFVPPPTPELRSARPRGERRRRQGERTVPGHERHRRGRGGWGGGRQRRT